MSTETRYSPNNPQGIVGTEAEYIETAESTAQVYVYTALEDAGLMDEYSKTGDLGLLMQVSDDILAEQNITGLMIDDGRLTMTVDIQGVERTFTAPEHGAGISSLEMVDTGPDELTPDELEAIEFERQLAEAREDAGLDQTVAPNPVPF